MLSPPNFLPYADVLNDFVNISWVAVYDKNVHLAASTMVYLSLKPHKENNN